MRNTEDEPSHVAPERAGSRMKKIAVGRVLRPHGLKGEVKFVPFFDDIQEIIKGAAVELSPAGQSASIVATPVSFRGSGQSLIVKFTGYDNPENARILTNRTVLVERDLMPDLPDGHYYYEEIVGLPVFGEDGVKIGSLRDFFPAGDKDVWEIETVSGGEILIPCLPETVLNVDLKEGTITVRPMETIL